MTSDLEEALEYASLVPAENGGIITGHEDLQREKKFIRFIT